MVHTTTVSIIGLIAVALLAVPSCAPPSEGNDLDKLRKAQLKIGSHDFDVWLAADVFHGDGDGVFGQFDDRDRVLLGVRRTF